jgi:hypothetical protein
MNVPFVQEIHFFPEKLCAANIQNADGAVVAHFLQHVKKKLKSFLPEFLL